MNEDIVKGRFHQFRGEAKKQWAKLTDNDTRLLEGHWEKLAGLLQERYGYTHERAEREAHEFTARVSRWLDEREKAMGETEHKKAMGETEHKKAA